MSKYHTENLAEKINNIDIANIVAKNNAQVSRFISEGNPNIQEGASDSDKQKIGKPASSISNDQQEAYEVKQAFKNDQSLSDVASDIQVTVKDGAITLDGQVSTKQQMNLATNTATAVGMVDKVNNRMKLTENIDVQPHPKD